MNEYPKSVWNNMVNTTPHRNNDYNIQISQMPDPQASYQLQKKINLKTIIIPAAIAAAMLMGFSYVGYVQDQNFLEATEVVNTMELPGDVTLNITKNSDNSYFLMPDGQHVGNYNGIEARDMARGQVENIHSMGK